jgi:hypothetical protein
MDTKTKSASALANGVDSAVFVQAAAWVGYSRVIIGTGRGLTCGR